MTRCAVVLGADSRPLTDRIVLDRFRWLSPVVCLPIICLLVLFLYTPGKAGGGDAAVGL